MMIAMVAMLLWIRVSVLMTAHAAFLHSHQMQGYDQQVPSPMLSRKLMIQEMVEGNGDQNLVFDNDQKEALLDEQKRGKEVMVNAANRYDPASFTTMDYSNVRRRHSVHNNSFPKPNSFP